MRLITKGGNEFLVQSSTSQNRSEKVIRGTSKLLQFWGAILKNLGFYFFGILGFTFALNFILI